MSEKLRILITGFGPFPGAPFNPTMPLVKRLTRLRRPALDDVELTGHIFPVTYADGRPRIAEADRANIARRRC